MTDSDATPNPGPPGLTNPKHPPPGSTPRRRLRFQIDYELIACGLHGHELVGVGAAEIRPSDSYFVRVVEDGWRSHRCLRCDAWVLLEVPAEPTMQFPPDPADVTMPLKGKRLRDRYVLRLIVLDRAVHFIVLAALAAAIFLFAQHRAFLHHDYVKVLNALQGSFGGPTGSKSFVVRDLNRLFKLSSTTLYLVGVVLAAYAAILAAEVVGLWRARRWAEYLTFVETGALIPLEIYELATSVTPLKVVALVLNVAVVAYLLVAHRLFGVRGGRAAAIAAYGDEG
jgi:uncharacterized membrane protein (DUF2068 family)